jgi:hypothetical protein
MIGSEGGSGSLCDFLRLTRKTDNRINASTRQIATAMTAIAHAGNASSSAMPSASTLSKSTMLLFELDCAFVSTLLFEPSVTTGTDGSVSAFAAGVAVDNAMVSVGAVVRCDVACVESLVVVCVDDAAMDICDMGASPHTQLPWSQKHAAPFWLIETHVAPCIEASGSETQYFEPPTKELYLHSMRWHCSGCVTQSPRLSHRAGGVGGVFEVVVVDIVVGLVGGGGGGGGGVVVFVDVDGVLVRVDVVVVVVVVTVTRSQLRSMLHIPLLQ